MKPWELTARWRASMIIPKADTRARTIRTRAQRAICSRPQRRQSMEGNVGHDHKDHRIILEDATVTLKWHDRSRQFFGTAPRHKKSTHGGQNPSPELWWTKMKTPYRNVDQKLPFAVHKLFWSELARIGDAGLDSEAHLPLTAIKRMSPI